MKKEADELVLSILGKEHAFEILTRVYERGPSTASMIAKDLNLHIATVVKHLTELYEIGLLERTVKVCKTRDAFEYKVKDPKIEISIDLERNKNKEYTSALEALKFYFSVLFLILNKARKVVGNEIDAGLETELDGFKTKKEIFSLLTKEMELELAIKRFEERYLKDVNANELGAILSELILLAIENSEKRLGKLSTKALVTLTTSKIIEDYGNLIEKNDLLRILPAEYFERGEKK